jgi:putative membrane protein PagO
MQRGTKVAVFGTLCLIWSSTWVMIKVGLQGAPPLTSAGLRFIIAAFLILAIVAWRRIKLPHSRSFFVLSLYLGVFQLGIAYALVYWSEQYLSSGLTAILFSTMPLMVAVLARIFLGDRLAMSKIAGIVIGILGVYTIFRGSISLGGEGMVLGVVAALGSAFFASVSSIIVKRFSKSYNPFASILLPHAIAGVLLTTVGLSVERSSPMSWSPTTHLTVLYLAVFGSVSAFALYFWIIKHLDVTVLAYQTFIIPVLASVIGWIFLHETITLSTAVGGGLIVAGIALAVIPLSRKRSRGAS